MFIYAHASVWGRYSKHPKALTPAQTAVPGQRCWLLLYSVLFLWSFLLLLIPLTLSFSITSLLLLLFNPCLGRNFRTVKPPSLFLPVLFFSNALEASGVQGSMPFLTCTVLTVSFSVWIMLEMWLWMLEVSYTLKCIAAYPALSNKDCFVGSSDEVWDG